MSELNSPQAALQMSAPTIEEVRDAAAAFSYGSPLIENGYRGLIAEILVAEALGAEWRICSGGWSGWDLEHVSGCRIEVKQSAARQTWAAPKKASAPSFGISEKTGYFEDGIKWTPQAGRPAHIYVFAYHPIIDQSADHRDARQWQFHVVVTSQLPATKSITLAKLKSISETVKWGGLRTVVEQTRARFEGPPHD